LIAQIDWLSLTQPHNRKKEPPNSPLDSKLKCQKAAPVVHFPVGLKLISWFNVSLMKRK